MPFLSVIIPVYQAEKFLNKCVDSILKGQFQDFEIILVDDGCRDRSPEICDEYAAKDRRVRVIHQKNGGVTSARKAGVQMAEGVYATFVDSDDYITEGYEKMALLARQEDPDVICGRMIVQDRFGHETVMEEVIPCGTYGRQEIRDLLFQLPYCKKYGKFGIFPSLANKWFRRELLEKWQLREAEDITIGEDLAVSYPCIAESSKICLTDITYYHYMCNEDSITRKYIGSEAEVRKVDVFYRYLLELSKEEFGPAVLHQLDLYRIRLMITAFEKEFARSNPVGFLEKFRRVHRVMKSYGSYVKGAVLAPEIALDRNFRDCVSLWKKGCFFLAAGFIFLRKIEKKAGLLK